MLFYITGKSASGKDRLYKELLKKFGENTGTGPDAGIHLRPVVRYTTRPIRTGETDGVQYHFTTEAGLDIFRKAGRIIEECTYQTAAGPWTYATVDYGIDPRTADYLAIGALAPYIKLRDYFGQRSVILLYINVSDRELLTRSINRESEQETPHYKEICRRFLADSSDFSEEKLAEAGVVRRYDNNGPFEDCLAEIARTIVQYAAGNTERSRARQDMTGNNSTYIPPHERGAEQ